MPFKTPSGTHYHIIYHCHGATIPCDTTGLAPCTDCCNGNGGVRVLTRGDEIRLGIGGSPYIRATSVREGVLLDDTGRVEVWGGESGRAYAEADGVARHLVDELDARMNYLPDFDEKQFAQLLYETAAKNERDNPGFDAATFYEVLTRETAQRGPEYAQVVAEQMLYDGNRGMEAGREPRRMPLVRRIADGAATATRKVLGTVHLAIAKFGMAMTRRREIGSIKRHYGCDDYTATVIRKIRREDELAPVQQETDETIRYDALLRQSARQDASGNVPPIEDVYEEVAFEHIAAITDDVMDRCGYEEQDRGATERGFAVIEQIRNRLEERGYADKITTGMVERLRRERKYPAFDALIVALEDASRASGARKYQSRISRARVMTQIANGEQVHLVPEGTGFLDA